MVLVFKVRLLVMGLIFSFWELWDEGVGGVLVVVIVIVVVV